MAASRPAQAAPRRPAARNLVLAAALALLPAAAAAQEGAVHDLTAGGEWNAATAPPYSPYVDRDYPIRPLFGDSHMHTSLSADAQLAGNRLPPAAAYRFARGETVMSSTGQRARLSRPLDWLAVADHSDGMGMMDDIVAGKPELMAYDQAAAWSAGLAAGGAEATKAKDDLTVTFSAGKVEPGLIAMYAPGSRAFKRVWERTVAAAETYNEPGRFTAMIGFEWTSYYNGRNLHRVVLLRDDADRALQVVPMTTTPPQGSQDPMDLWKYMAAYEEKTAGEMLAIPHNGNMSNGEMFRIDRRPDGSELTKDWAMLRSRWEPLYEMTQVKGDGETHPFLSPDDEFADFENWDEGDEAKTGQPKTPEMFAGEYARSALLRGLALEERLGVNPYQFGMIGATDSHTSLATTRSENYFGKNAATDEPMPKRMHRVLKLSGDGKNNLYSWQITTSGLAGVWAKENTRAAIFDAMMRKEVYATTGTRITLRLFGGWDFSDKDLLGRAPAGAGYARGVPMGGTLRAAPEGATAPSFMVYALRDPMGANLDRIQIVKGWLDADGAQREKVFDVAWSGARQPGDDGKLPPVGDTTDAATASWTNTIGAAELGTVWTDPEYDPAQRAFYYARVLEIPTPRWTTYDAMRFGVELPKGVPVSVQQRAYSSPIWAKPNGA